MHQPLQRILGIAEDEQAQGGQMLGFIALKPSASAPRDPLREVWL
jgi:hypothetical protein